MAQNRIVLGLDGSEGAARALEWTLSLAREIKAEIVAVYVYSPPIFALFPTGVPSSVYDFDAVRADIAGRLEHEWCRPLADAGVQFRAVVKQGHHATVLMEVADLEDASMIVVGNRGMGGFKGLLLGSVSQQLSTHARRPLVIVPSRD